MFVLDVFYSELSIEVEVPIRDFLYVSTTTLDVKHLNIEVDLVEWVLSKGEWIV